MAELTDGDRLVISASCRRIADMTYPLKAKREEIAEELATILVCVAGGSDEAAALFKASAPPPTVEPSK